MIASPLFPSAAVKHGGVLVSPVGERVVPSLANPHTRQSRARRSTSPRTIHQRRIVLRCLSPLSALLSLVLVRPFQVPARALVAPRASSHASNGSVRLRPLARCLSALRTPSIARARERAFLSARARWVVVPPRAFSSVSFSSLSSFFSFFFSFFRFFSLLSSSRASEAW